MIYFFSLISGYINGIFASGAGQILVFCLIYILNIETHEARATSVFVIGIITTYTLVKYLQVIDIKILDVIIVSVIGAAFGFLGAKLFKKIPSKYLNIISGVILVIFSIISLIKK